MVIINLPKQVQYIINTLEENEFEAYVVGGCVRDSLLGLTPHDWDVCTSAKPTQIMKCFENYRIIETGLQHGTITVVIDEIPHEITTYRIDGKYLDNRHPEEVIFVDNLKEDLKRRDFTINAMAYNHKSGLVDYFNGIEDLKEEYIRCVGNPNDRFAEDALRIMRALRFASTYGFTIEEETNLSIHMHRELLNNIAVERISSEICKLLCGENAKNILNTYSDVLEIFIPEFGICFGFKQNNPYHIYDVYNHILHALDNYTGEDLIIKLSLLFHDIGKPYCYTEDNNGGGHFYGHGIVSSDLTKEILTRLKFDNKTIKDVTELVLDHDSIIEPTTKIIKRWLNKMGEQQLRRLIEIKIADISAHSEINRDERLRKTKELTRILDVVIAEKQCFTLKNLDINGNDLIAIGIPEGKSIGVILNTLMNMVIEEKIINDKDILLYKCRSFINNNEI